MRAQVLSLGLLLLALGPDARAAPDAPPDDVGSGATLATEEGAVDHPSESACRPRTRRVRTVIDGKANLNTASVELLQRLPGVGRGSAERIVERRARRPFHRIEELVRVKGFGVKRFQRVRRYLTVEGPSTLRPVWVLPREEVVAQREGPARP